MTSQRRRRPPASGGRAMPDRLSLTKPELKKLYHSAGAEAGMRGILRDFYARMSRDVMIGHFFIGRNTDDIAEKQLGFLERAMGIAASYSGKPPSQAHEKLPDILTGHFDRRLRILEATLRDHGLSDEDIRIWVAFENAFREGIVKG